MESKKKMNVEQVVDAVLSYIIDRKIRIGKKLPPEEELAKTFNVSRLCLRDALRGLKFLGMLETGTRRGTTVQEINFDLLCRVIGFQIAMSDFSYQELLDARVVIELGAIGKLIDKAPNIPFEELDALADCGDEEVDLRERQKRDFAFHNKLISLSGNTIFNSFSHMLELFFLQPLKNLSDTGTLQRVNDEHRLLIRAIRERNIKMAEGLLVSHLAKYTTKIQNKGRKAK